MRKFIEEFKAFALRGNVMDMAVGVIIGGAFSGIVTSLTYTLTDVSGFASAFVSSVINFIIMAFVLFCLMKIVNTAMNLGHKKEEEPAAPTTKVCPYCKSTIPIDATRCAHCTSDVSEA